MTEQERIQNDIERLMAAQNLRTQQAYEKERNNIALNWLAGFLIIGTALIILVGFAKYQNEQAAQQKEQELKQTIQCK